MGTKLTLVVLLAALALRPVGGAGRDVEAAPERDAGAVDVAAASTFASAPTTAGAPTLVATMAACLRCHEQGGVSAGHCERVEHLVASGEHDAAVPALASCLDADNAAGLARYLQDLERRTLAQR